MYKFSRGFTLIELMITVAIIGILAAVVYPNYTESVNKGRRSECKSAILQTATLLERFYTTNNTYSATMADIGGKAFSGNSANASACTLTIAPFDVADTTLRNGFIVTGTPTRTDAKCGNLTLAHQGGKTESGTESIAYCW